MQLDKYTKKKLEKKRVVRRPFHATIGRGTARTEASRAARGGSEGSRARTRAGARARGD